jgi:hypothetical protein
MRMLARGLVMLGETLTGRKYMKYQAALDF